MENIQQNNQEELELLAKNNTILQVVAGSHAYGTNIPGSDWDERGIFVDNIERICLPFKKIEQVQLTEDDIVIYELSKYMPLLLEQNPNVIELLWTDPKDITKKTELGDLLIENRKNFLSIAVKDSYVGYATSQLTRIKGHNKWINNPQNEEAPQAKEFMSVIWNSTDNKEYNKKVPTDGFFAINLGNNQFALFKNKDKTYFKHDSWFDNKGNPIPVDKTKEHEIKKSGLQPDMFVKFNKAQYETSHDNWKNYWKWKNNRNQARSVLEEKFGYDVKHAMHLIRLLRSGVDILEHGIVPVKRPDAEYLLKIRNGEFTYEEIVKESERLTQKVQDISLKSSLPEKADINLAKQIMLEIYSRHWNMSVKNTNSFIKNKM